MPSLANWLGSAPGGREADTAKEIAADPTTVAVKRAGVVLPHTLIVRIVADDQGQTRRGAASQSTTGAVRILAAVGTDLRREDRLQAEGGSVYLVTFVPPGQEWRLEAQGEVVG